MNHHGLITRAAPILALWGACAAVSATDVDRSLAITGYTIKELPRLVADLPCVAFGVNVEGIVVGRCQVADVNYHAVKWVDGVVMDIHPAHADNSGASAINSAGEIAGNAVGATRWNKAGVAVALPALRGDEASHAYAIGEDGTVVGTSLSPEGDEWHATSWPRAKPRDIGKRSGSGSAAHGINANGQIAGHRKGGVYPNDHWRAIVWQDGQVKKLELVDGMQDCQSRAINGAGLVVGYCSNGLHWPNVAALWIDGQVTALGGIGGEASVAAGINTQGLIVGWSNLPGTFDFHATMWRKGRVMDLNDLLAPADRDAGWLLTNALAVNDHGVVVGAGSCPGRTECAFVMTPVR